LIQAKDLRRSQNVENQGDEPIGSPLGLRADRRDRRLSRRRRIAQPPQA
jgi:hypothetical protein